MHVLVTGATGWIGAALVPELLASGHEVTGLARSARSAEALAGAGAGVLRGDLDDLELIRGAARAVDGVVHLAYKHEEAFGHGDAAAAAAADRAVVEAFGEALTGTNRPLVTASSLAGHSSGRTITERDMAAETTGATERLLTERLVLGLADRAIRSSVVRIPPVHGDGDRSFLSWFVDVARRTGVAGFVEDGANRWPAVHVSDAARLFRLALESAPAGSVLHGVAEPGVSTRDIAEMFGRGLDLPARSVTPEHFGATLGAFAGFDIVASSEHTRELLDWMPVGPALLDDLRAGHYFAAANGAATAP